jgi:hypothetical protein
MYSDLQVKRESQMPLNGMDTENVVHLHKGMAFEILKPNL